MKKINYKKLQIIILSVSLVIILVCSLYLTNICSYASGISGGALGSAYNVNASPLIRDTSLSVTTPYLKSDSSYITYYTNCYNNGFTVTDRPEQHTYEISKYPNYIIFVYSNVIHFLQLPEKSFVIFNNSQYQIYAESGYYVAGDISWGGQRIECFTFNNNGTYNGYDGPNYSNYTNNTVTVDDDAYGGIYTSIGYGDNNNNCVLDTNIPVFYNTSTSNLPSDFDSMDNYNPNYSSGTSGESAVNNLIMSESDWVFKHSDYYAPYSDVINTGSVYPNGNIYFQFEPNDFQKENASDFTVSLSFSFDYDVTYSYNASSDTPPFYNTMGLVTLGQKSCKLHFNYSNNGNETIDVPLSSFISNGNSYHISFEDVMSNMSGSGYTLSNVLALSKEVTSLSYNKFNINCTAFITSSNESSGNYSEWYNPINRKGYTTDKSAETNKNPYVEENQDYNDTSLNVPGTAGTDGDNANNVGGGSSASATTGSITINNTNNNSATSGSLFDDGIISTLLKLVSNNVVSSSETVSELADVDGFSSVAQSSYSYIPTSIWSLLLVMFTASLGILIIGFIIRIVVNIFF